MSKKHPSKTPPKNNATPLGTKRSHTAKTPKPVPVFGQGRTEDVVPPTLDATPIASTDEKISSVDTNTLDTPAPIVVPSSQSPGNPASDQPSHRSTPVEITLIRDTKARKTKWNFNVYGATGYRGSVRISNAYFEGGKAPDTLVVTNDAFGGPKAIAAKMTKEERAAARKAAPKLTLAEKIAKREKALERDKAKLAASLEPALAI